MTTLRPFDQCDWDSYSGCESSQPMIAELDKAILIQDGNAIQIDTTDYDVDDLDDIYICHKAYVNQVQARQLAKALVDAYEALPYDTWLVLATESVSMPRAS
jgi:hypothetical protein